MRTEDPFLSIGEIARRMNASTRSAIRRIEEGEIPTYKFGGLVRVKQSDFDNYVERSRRGDAAPVEQAHEPIRRKPRPRTHGAPA
jgi:excisionase family DNA binding protein